MSSGSFHEEAGSAPPTEAEQHVIAEIAYRRDELIDLITDLVGFDTTTRAYDTEPARDEAALQEYLAARLRDAGAVTDVWEPAPADVTGSPMIPSGLRFDGRPQMAARFPGTGQGRTLLLNGHIDVVTVEPRDRWTSDPFQAEVRDDNLYGRGACDMKGGIAAMVFAAEILASLGHRLVGDLIICTVTDEESTGAGGLAAVAHGVRADAGIVTEPTGLEVQVACRGSLIPTVTVTGRPGHAGLPQQHWRGGGAVNAIDKATIIIDSMRRLEAEWRERARDHHPYLSPGDIVPVEISGGEWIVSIPAECRLVYHIAYLPKQADSNGWGTLVRKEVSEWISRACDGDDWLSQTPAGIEWAPEVPPADVPADHPIVPIMLASAEAIGRPARVSGANFWHDGATFTMFGTPSIAFGPGDGASTVHIVDEHVPIDQCVAAAQALAIAAMRFCGTP